MQFTNEQLQKMIAKEPVGDSYPYYTKDENQIEKYIKDLFYKFNRSKSIQCEAMFDHYGSGYASYVDFFFYKRDGSSVLSKKYIEKDSLTSFEIDGLVLYISRLAPVAIFGKDIRSKAILETSKGKKEYFSGFSMLSQSQEVIKEVPGKWKDNFREIKLKLDEAGYMILDKTYLEQPLPFKAKIETFTHSNQYKLFDAIFYWMD